MRSFVGACLAGALTITACESTPKPAEARASGGQAPAPSAGDSATEGASGQDFSRQAHTAALESLDPLIEAYLSQVQAVFHASALGEPLSTPYAPGADETDLRAQLESIQKKTAEIRRPALDVRDARRLDAYLDLLRRDQWRFEGVNPATSDALEYLYRVEQLVSELRYRLLQAKPCPGCKEALSGLPAGLARAKKALSTASRPNLAAAKARADVLADRLEELSPLLDDPGRDQLRTATSALRSYGAELSALPLVPAPGETGPHPWSSEPTGRVPPALFERPSKWGAERLEKVFEAEENYKHSAGSLRANAQAHLTRFRKMRKNLAERTQPPKGSPAPAPASPVDVERCERAFEPMRAFARSKAGFDPVLSCERLATWLEGQRLNDEALDALLISEGLVPGSIHDLARKRGGVIAAIGGRWTRSLAPEYRTIMLAFPLGNRSTGDAALARLESHLCLATAALEVHGGASDAGLDDWLSEWCPERKPAAWREAALADPRDATTGIPAAMMGPLPTDMVPVVEYGWTLYGTAILLARPLDAPDPNNAKAEPTWTVQPIDPSSP